MFQKVIGDKTMIEVNCLGTEKFELGEKTTRRYARVWNDRYNQYDDMLILEYEDKCPVCKTDILVRAREGAWTLACCSRECYDKYHKAKEDGTLGELCGWNKK